MSIDVSVGYREETYSVHRCETCKWWEKPVKERENQGRCTHRSMDSEEDDGIYVMCQDQIDCLITGPKFGCVHHSPTENKTQTNDTN